MKRRLGFTLIELLATLTIMAVMAGMLFPFVSNYTRKAKKDTSLRSLKLFNDAMDRYIAVSDDPDPAGWTSRAEVNWHNPDTLETVTLCCDVGSATAGQEGSVLIQNLTTGQNQTIRIPTGGFKWDDVFVYKIVPDTGHGVDPKFVALFYSMDHRGGGGWNGGAFASGNNSYVDTAGNTYDSTQNTTFVRDTSVISTIY